MSEPQKTILKNAQSVFALTDERKKLNYDICHHWTQRNVIWIPGPQKSPVKNAQSVFTLTAERKKEIYVIFHHWT